MPDVFSKAKRSAVMARIRSRGNQATEIALARVLRRNGITGWRRHRPVFGRPDFIFSRVRLALFVDGCFWHGCPRHGSQPRGNRAFWRKKFQRNRERDRLVNRILRKSGWRVLRIWEHELAKKREPRLVRRIGKFLIGKKGNEEKARDCKPRNTRTTRKILAFGFSPSVPKQAGERARPGRSFPRPRGKPRAH